MNLKGSVAREIVGGIIGTAIVVLLVDKLKISPFWLLLLVPLVLIAVQSAGLRLRMQVFRSGLASFYMNFPVPEGPKYWRDAKTEMVYWGVTGGTIFNDLRTVLLQDKSLRRNYRFLLMSPSGHALRDQICFMRDVVWANADARTREEIQEECKVAETRLANTVTMLLNTEVCKRKRLEVRLFDEFLPWWVYVMDNETMVIGILKRGQEVGEQSAAVLRSTKDQCTLFDAFHGNFERVWNGARVVRDVNEMEGMPQPRR
jgi:hypothetical protein